MTHELPVDEDTGQGWVAPTAPEDPRGLATVPEGLGEYDRPPEPSQRYSSMPVLDVSPADEAPRQFVGDEPTGAEAMREAPYGAEYYPEMDHGAAGVGAGAYGFADMGLGYMNDAVPSLPPMTAQQQAHYASLTPVSRDSPLENTDANRAYMEGVGGTKALQEAASRSGNFPSALDTVKANNYTPGMFAVDEHTGRSLSPSALRPFGRQPPGGAWREAEPAAQAAAAASWREAEPAARAAPAEPVAERLPQDVPLYEPSYPAAPVDLAVAPPPEYVSAYAPPYAAPPSGPPMDLPPPPMPPIPAHLGGAAPAYWGGSAPARLSSAEPAQMGGAAPALGPIAAPPAVGASHVTPSYLADTTTVTHPHAA